MSQILTYILAPNFTFATNANYSDPDQWLGNIIQDPFNPLSVLDFHPDPVSLVQNGITSVIEEKNSISRSRGHSISQSVHARFLQIISAKLGYKLSKDKETTYNMRQMETRYLKHDPTNEQITQRVEANSKIQTAMKSGIMGRTPVYMISGLKIAKGLEVTQKSMRGKGIHLDANATVTPDESVAVGGSTEVDSRHAECDSSSSTEDVVFAYQLHLITHKGWGKTKRIEANVFKSKAAFLGADNDEICEDNVVDEMDVKLADHGDFRTLFKDEIQDGEIIILDDGNSEDPNEDTRHVFLYAVPESEEDGDE